MGCAENASVIEEEVARGHRHAENCYGPGANSDCPGFGIADELGDPPCEDQNPIVPPPDPDGSRRRLFASWMKRGGRSHTKRTKRRS